MKARYGTVKTDILLAWLAGKALTLAVFLVYTGMHPDITLHDAFDRWDSPSYITIAQSGYPPCVPCRQGYLTAFLPGFPFLIWLARWLLIDGVVAGVAVTLIAELVALFYVYKLVEHERDRSSARFVIWCLALAPFGVFLSMAYTESPFLAAAAASLYYARTGNRRNAVVAAAFACCFRLTGAILVPVLMVEFLSKKRNLPSLVLPVLALLPMALFVWSMAVTTGDAKALLDSNRIHFNHVMAPPWTGFIATWSLFADAHTAGDKLIWGREVVSGVAGLLTTVLVGIWWLRGRFASSLALYVGLGWGIATAISFWLSVGRYELAMFPALIVLADVTKRRPVTRPVLVTAGAALMVWQTVIFASGAWLA